MDPTEVQAIYSRFAAPLVTFAAKSPKRRELAEMLVHHLWMAMMGGPELEEETWKTLGDVARLDENLIRPIRQLYDGNMRTAVSDTELLAVRACYQLKRKQPT